MHASEAVDIFQQLILLLSLLSSFFYLVTRYILMYYGSVGSGSAGCSQLWVNVMAHMAHASLSLSL